MVRYVHLRKEAECEQLRQTVAKLQAQLKASEKRVDQLSSAAGLVADIYKKNAEYICRAETAEKEADDAKKETVVAKQEAAEAKHAVAEATKEVADAKKQAAGWKRLARKRKNAMLKAKKENVALATELKKLKRGSAGQRYGAAESVMRSAVKLLDANAVNAAPVECPTTKKSPPTKVAVKTAVQRYVQAPSYNWKATVTLEELRQHMENASSFWDKDKAKMVCPVCTKGLSAKGASHVLDHLMTHVSRSYYPYKCPAPGCHFTFVQASLVPRHAWNKHELSWNDAMNKQMRHESNLRRFEEFRELANKSVVKPHDAH
ncbi:hypothetical protein AAVH_14286 [Aphelenchoides avenae]|nr:hypothetical protein AAVH_14286 [Aphelenchus avenae]